MQYVTTTDKKQHVAEYLGKLTEAISKLDHQEISDTLTVIERAFLAGKYIWIAGNGGSAATASHMASDLQKTTLGKDPQSKNGQFKFRAISISDNIPVMTAWGNDEGYEHIFSQQLKTLGNPGDCLVVITGSGNSKNILTTVEEAKKMGMDAVGFLGFDGGKVRPMLDASIVVRSTEYGPIEDLHMVFDHLMTAYFKRNIS